MSPMRVISISVVAYKQTDLSVKKEASIDLFFKDEKAPAIELKVPTELK